MNKTLKTQLKGWYPVLSDTLESDYFSDVKASVKDYMKIEEVYPKGSDIMKAFSLCPIEETKVVIIGQDPYHDGTATGLAFANPTHCESISPSLRMIIEEIETDVGMVVLPFNQNLEHWAPQGVLLLNTALTVNQGKPGSHITVWDKFTTDFIKSFSKVKQKVVYMLWGRYAQGYEKYIHKNNHILTASHPVNEIYRGKGKGGFLGCNHFTKANEIILKEHGEDEQIEWRYTPEQLEYLKGDGVIKDNFDDLV